MDSSELSIFFKNTEQAEITDRYLLQINQSFTALQSQLEQQNQKIESLEAKIIGQYQTIIDILQPKVKIEKQIDEHKSDLKPNITINTSRTIGEKEGIWIDQSTGLMWSRINIGQKWLNGECYGEASALDWKQAQESCKIFNLAGFRDWRLPSIEELRTLVQQNKAGYSCSENMLFKPTELAWGDYWSSSFHSYFDDNTFVWYLNFNSTESSNSWEIISRYVRLVRKNK